ncbi:MAG: hypothetical protein IJD65_05735 [Mailhella sp.]|nr:hypothetical protein [Mailhella sp.]
MKEKWGRMRFCQGGAGKIFCLPSLPLRAKGDGGFRKPCPRTAAGHAVLLLPLETGAVAGTGQAFGFWFPAFGSWLLAFGALLNHAARMFAQCGFMRVA